MLKSLTHGSILLLSSLILSGCGELSTLILGTETLYSKNTEPLTGATPSISDNSEATRQALLRFTNRERAKKNRAALVMNSALNKAAQTHAEDMAAKDFLAHQGSDHSEPADRVKRTAYPHSYRGENIAYNFSNAEGVIAQWMSSPGHRENMLDEYTNEIGTGYAVSQTSGRHYYVQVFGETAIPALSSPSEAISAEDPTVSEMAEAIRNHPGSRARDIITSLEIAQAAENAAAQFGLAPRQLLAVWAHESQFGHTRSEGNGAGLGQLTRPAVEELQRIGKGGRDGNRRGTSDATYAMIRDPRARVVFERLDSFASLISIEDNAIGSAAYLRLMLDVHQGDQIAALRAYNGSGGAIEQAYPGRVADAHQALFGRPLPAILERR